jgi:hypothetical protein
MKRVPKLKTHSDAKAHNGSAEAFDDAKIKGAKTIPTPEKGGRDGFTKRVYTTACGKGNLPRG